MRLARWQWAVLTLVTVAFLLTAFYKSRYPYGWSHCCDKILDKELHHYAEDHDGAFPAGEETPEASLSLLYPRYPDADANLLRGKTVPEKVVRQILEGGGRLGPDTCGWHYVEGLRKTDDSELALFWDKAGLGHNGERMEGGRRVTLLSGTSKFIPTSEWAAFREEQARLRAALGPGRVVLEPAEE